MTIQKSSMREKAINSCGHFGLAQYKYSDWLLGLGADIWRFYFMNTEFEIDFDSDQKNRDIINGIYTKVLGLNKLIGGYIGITILELDNDNTKE